MKTWLPGWMLAGFDIAERARQVRRVTGGYTGEQLREIRAVKGVGRPPFPGEWDSWSRGAQADQAVDALEKWHAFRSDHAPNSRVSKGRITYRLTALELKTLRGESGLSRREFARQREASASRGHVSAAV